MRNFRRAFLAPILATVALLVGAPAAPAQEQEFVTFQEAELITPFLVQVSGTVQCEPGDSVDVSAELRQRPNTSGYGLTSFVCTETNQTFVVDVTGGPFHPGPATLFGLAFRYGGPSGFAFDRDNRGIRIQP
ncbi:MAG: hypothetical protein LC808_13235 [Actinobacteria bacterium]|nr:hypothetical protein [Actinomycetota bacterium]